MESGGEEENNSIPSYAPLIGISLVTFGFIAALIPFFPSSLRIKTLHKQLPFQGTTSTKIEQIAKLLQRHAAESRSSTTSVKRKEFLDVGCGDGRVLWKLSRLPSLKRQFDVYRGIEINSTLYWICKFKSLFKRNILIEKKDFFHLSHRDLANVDAVFLFGIPGLMEQFRDAFESKLESGSVVLTNKFELPGRLPKYREGEISLYIIENQPKEESKI